MYLHTHTHILLITLHICTSSAEQPAWQQLAHMGRVYGRGHGQGRGRLTFMPRCTNTKNRRQGKECKTCRILASTALDCRCEYFEIGNFEILKSHWKIKQNLSWIYGKSNNCSAPNIYEKKKTNQFVWPRDLMLAPATCFKFILLFSLIFFKLVSGCWLLAFFLIFNVLLWWAFIYFHCPAGARAVYYLNEFTQQI